MKQPDVCTDSLRIINVNTVLNIMRKVFDDSAKRIIDRGLLFNPMKLNDLSH